MPPSLELVASPRQGVGLLQWSAAGRFLASRSDVMPCANPNPTSTTTPNPNPNQRRHAVRAMDLGRIHLRTTRRAAAAAAGA
eukprot:scaffold104387_cov57-Phaeocystis_antarctica.AAC.1